MGTDISTLDRVGPCVVGSPASHSARLCNCRSVRTKAPFSSLRCTTAELLAAVGVEVCIHIADTPVGQVIFSSKLQPWIRTFFSLSLTTNLLATRLYFCHFTHTRSKPYLTYVQFSLQRVSCGPIAVLANIAQEAIRYRHTEKRSRRSCSPPPYTPSRSHPFLGLTSQDQTRSTSVWTVCSRLLYALNSYSTFATYVQLLLRRASRSRSSQYALASRLR